ncbi:MAG: hypothetical protein ACL93V_13660 [Candidatus Electrothrix sp. YB6]
MIRFCRIGLSALLVLSLVRFYPLSVQAGERPVSLSIPESTLQQTLQNLLPLPVELGKHGGNLQGTFRLDSISRLALRKDMISLQGKVSGRHLRASARVAGQTIQIKLKEVVLPVTCDIALRFDRKKKTLFLTPACQDLLQDNPSAAPLRPLLDSLRREYPLPLDNLQPLTGTAGGVSIYVHLDPVDIRAEKNALILQFQPVAGKQQIAQSMLYAP